MSNFRFSPTQIAALADYYEFERAMPLKETPQYRLSAFFGQLDTLIERANNALGEFDWWNAYASEPMPFVEKEIQRRRAERVEQHKFQKRREQRRAAARHDLELAFA